MCFFFLSGLSVCCTKYQLVIYLFIPDENIYCRNVDFFDFFYIFLGGGGIHVVSSIGKYVCLVLQHLNRFKSGDGETSERRGLSAYGLCRAREHRVGQNSADQVSMP